MEKLVIELTNQKAYRLLKELEELNLIKMIKTPSTNLSSLRKKVQDKMSDSQIDEQLQKLREEWQRDI
ncbi:hypothetical protein [Sphingobacterium pedocola]|uniref:Transcriptional regulator n=1 Tax=Sphingobacterium pedocola TaxID=2082722 RepID=A0ABR9T1Y0_9SPHI|nr:hypothetical protein [Sphingobacterium pedocola]MBE8719343.1 hypothetical protein [Sphingobacterium pedocola]